MTRRPESKEPSVQRTRAELERLLRKWGVGGLSWVDDYEIGLVILRFRWKSNPEDELGYTARFTVRVPNDDDLEASAIDKRTGKFSEKKLTRLRKNRGKKQHHSLLYLIRAQLDAIKLGIMLPEQAFMSWIEDEGGITLFDKMLPELRQLSGAQEQKALEGEDEKV